MAALQEALRGFSSMKLTQSGMKDTRMLINQFDTYYEPLFDRLKRPVHGNIRTLYNPKEIDNSICISSLLSLYFALIWRKTIITSDIAPEYIPHLENLQRLLSEKVLLPHILSAYKFPSYLVKYSDSGSAFFFKLALDGLQMLTKGDCATKERIQNFNNDKMKNKHGVLDIRNWKIAVGSYLYRLKTKERDSEKYNPAVKQVIGNSSNLMDSLAREIKESISSAKHKLRMAAIPEEIIARWLPSDVNLPVYDKPEVETFPASATSGGGGGPTRAAGSSMYGGARKTRRNRRGRKSRKSHKASKARKTNKSRKNRRHQ